MIRLSFAQLKALQHHDKHNFHLTWKEMSLDISSKIFHEVGSESLSAPLSFIEAVM